VSWLLLFRRLHCCYQDGPNCQEGNIGLHRAQAGGLAVWLCCQTVESTTDNISTGND
jgi:hypothetical protein